MSSSLALFGVIALLVTAGCGGKILEEPDPLAVDAGTTESPVDVETIVDPFHAGDDWRGTYTCPQGPTQLDLHIVSAHDDVIDDALFNFDWTAGGTSGSFHLRGNFDPRTGSAVFTQTSWLSDPGPTWSMVGMAGHASDDTFAGNIDGPDCGSFKVTKM